MVDYVSERTLPQMRNRVFVFSTILLFTLLAAASAADVGGKWKGEMKTPDGNVIQISFNFQASGEQLKGTVTTDFGEDQITEGKIAGDELSFVVTPGGADFKISYKGKVAGDDLKMTAAMGEMGNMEVVAKRVK
jgi:hypothetical protein